MLTNLEVGSDDRERRAGLESAVPAGSRLWIASMTEGVLIVNVSDDIPEQASDRLPLMVGQLVLTVTSVDQIRGVRLQQGGHPIEAPLVGGALTTAVLVRANYEGLLGGADGIDSAAGPRR